MTRKMCVARTDATNICTKTTGCCVGISSFSEVFVAGTRQTYSRGGKLAARSVFSGPRKHSGIIFKCEYSFNLPQWMLVPGLLTDTCFIILEKVRPSAKRGLLKMASESN